jgi:prepilin-type N-terminal cleavage/methylation domain-containing protein
MHRRGFTLIELLVAISIMAILATIVYANLASSSKQSRDAKRQADLVMMKTAIEQYRAKWGRYPDAGCNNRNYWATERDCPDYITGSTTLGSSFVPSFLPSLPKDPSRNGNEGYSYIVNHEGTVYKLMAMNTVESEDVTHTHPFRSCDVNLVGSNYPNIAPNAPVNRDQFGWCASVDWNGSWSYDDQNAQGGLQDQPGWCKTSEEGGTKGPGGIGSRFSRSYGLWGGYAASTTASNSKGGDLKLTTIIICQ